MAIPANYIHWSRSTMRSLLVLGLFVLGSSVARAAVDEPLSKTSWSNFTTLNAITMSYGGVPARDFVHKGGDDDPSNGGTAVNENDDIGSAWPGGGSSFGNCNPQWSPAQDNCGPRPSGFFAFYYDDGTSYSPVRAPMSYLFMRMRIHGDPRANADPSDFKNGHWNFLMDIDADGYKEFWIDVYGGSRTVRVLYNDNASQQVLNECTVPGADTQGCPGPHVVQNVFRSCAVEPPDPEAPADCAFSVTRALPVTAVDAADPEPADWFIDMQMPVAAMTRYDGTNPQGRPLGTLTWDSRRVNPCLPDTPRPGTELTQFYPSPFTADDPLGAPGTWNGAIPFYYNPCTDPVPQSLPTNAKFLISTSASTTDPLQKDFIAGCINPPNGTCNYTDNTPVRLSYFKATSNGWGTRFDWSTNNEVGNVGFNLLAKTATGWTRVNEKLIPSAKFDSLERLDYSFDANGVKATAFVLEDVDRREGKRWHERLTADKEHGRRTDPGRPDWAGIRSEKKGKADARDKSWKADALAKSREAATRVASGIAPAAAGFPTVDLLVGADGIYRVTYEALLAAGLDLKTVPPTQIALTTKGQPVQISVNTPMTKMVVRSSGFGPGSSFDFYGTAVSSLYTRTNVYRVSVDPTLALRATRDSIAPGAEPPAAWYAETAEVHRDLGWSFAAPNGDPWYDQMVLAYTAPVSRSLPLQLDHVVPDGSDGSLRVGVWGVTDWQTATNDHHVQVSLNGFLLGERAFDGNVDAPVIAEVPSKFLQEGANTITLTLPGDTGVAYDLVALDRYSVTYPRAFVARNGSLAFRAAAPVFEVSGLPARSVVVYRLGGKGFQKVTGLRSSGSSGDYRVAFRGTDENDLYVVSIVAALGTPSAVPTPASGDISTGTAQYLVVSHPDFVSDLAPLVAAREAQGLSVKVVSVEDVYRQFSWGVVDPVAIQRYVAHAAANMGTEYVLLVGGDTIDYFDHLGTGSVSFVPSLYARTGPLVAFAPSDGLFADVTGDNIPDLAIGRLPVRTSADLATVVAKTLAYPAAGSAGLALFAADRAETSANFAMMLDQSVAEMPAGWTVQKAYVDDLGLAGAQSTLIGAINAGAAYTSYLGHSDTGYWSLESLFTSTHAAQLTNAGDPTIVAEWGCWNTFFVSPNATTLADVLLFSGDRGAAAVVGPASLASADGDQLMSRLLVRNLTLSGLPLGKALLAAKTEIGVSRPWLGDVLLGTNLMGDPALTLAP